MLTWRHTFSYSWCLFPHLSIAIHSIQSFIPPLPPSLRLTMHHASQWFTSARKMCLCVRFLFSLLRFTLRWRSPEHLLCLQWTAALCEDHVPQLEPLQPSEEKLLLLHAEPLLQFESVPMRNYVEWRVQPPASKHWMLWNYGRLQ